MGNQIVKNNYDFIEIGTSCFRTIVETCDGSQIGLSIEPVKEYLDRLPSTENVTKLWAAVVSDEDEKGLDFYYITEKNIDEHLNGSLSLKGCNRIGKPHDFHLNWVGDAKLAEWHNNKDRHQMVGINLVERGLVEKVTIPCVTYRYLMEKYNIGGVAFLKIDTEGYDCKILNSAMDYYEKNNELQFLPRHILFESNGHSSKDEVDMTRNRLQAMGYKITIHEGDTEAKL